ncbi:MAG: SAM-dependent methyltransferase, partial [Methylophilales bacterium 16-45-9]
MSISMSQQETLTSSLKKKNRAKWVAGFAKSQILSHLQHLTSGSLKLKDGDEVHNFGQDAAEAVINATIQVHDARFYGEIAFGGSIG